MRMIVAIVVVLGGARLASAEPSWAVGMRTTWNTQLDPPPWIMTGASGACGSPRTRG